MTHLHFVFAAVLLTACGGPGAPETPEGNSTPPSVSLEASATRGEAAFQVTFTASASDSDGDDLEYMWSVGPQSPQVGVATKAVLFEAEGAHAVTVVVSDGQTTASDSIEITVRDEYRPTDAPDVALIGFAGRCGPPACGAPRWNQLARLLLP